MKQGTIFIFEVRLLHSSPSVWRIIELKNSSTLHELHRVIQVAMGWENSHLYSFSQIKNEQSIEYILPEYASQDEIYHGNNPVDFKVKDLFFQTEDKMEYLYDFGDFWQHEVIFKGRKHKTSVFGYPACSAGAMACPPEDIGGVHGYKTMLEAIEKKSKKELEEYKVWLGYHFDPYYFSADKLLFFSKMLNRII